MDVKKIGVLHLNQIGDLVFSLPLLKALREAYPEAAIHSILILVPLSRSPVQGYARLVHAIQM